MPCDPIRNPVRDDQKIAQGQDASIDFTLKASATLGKTASKHFFQRRGSNPFGWLPAPLKHHIVLSPLSSFHACKSSALLPSSLRPLR